MNAVKDGVGLGDAAVAEPEAPRRPDRSRSSARASARCCARTPYWACAVQGVGRSRRPGKVQRCRTSRPPSTRASSINPRQLKRNAGGRHGAWASARRCTSRSPSTSREITDHDWVTLPDPADHGAAEDQGDRHEQPERRRLRRRAAKGPNGFVAAAIANAVFDATGKQPRRLPLIAEVHHAACSRSRLNEQHWWGGE